MKQDSKRAWQQGVQKVFYLVWKDFYLLAIAVICYDKFHGCTNWALNRIKRRKNPVQLHLFLETAQMSSVFIDILGEFVRTQRENEYLLLITDYYTKMMRTVPIKGISAAEVVRHFVHYWLLSYGPSNEHIPQNWGWFTWKYFQDVFRSINVRNNFTTIYFPSKNEEVESYEGKINTTLYTHVDDHSRYWDLSKRCVKVFHTIVNCICWRRALR